MKAFFALALMVVTSSSAFAYTIECKSSDLTIQVFHIGGAEHRVQILEENTLIGKQGSVFCGQSTSYGKNGKTVGGSCNSHLTVGGDNRYRQPADFDINFTLTAGKQPSGGRAKAIGTIQATYLNQITKQTQSIALSDVSCLVNN